MALITYDDKDNSLPTSNPRRLFRDVDANEIKDVVNENATELNSKVQSVTGDGVDNTDPANPVVNNVNAATALTDAASMDLTAIKHTLTTSSATRTFTISYTGDDISMKVILNATSSVFAFPAGALCVNSDGSASGDNTCSLAGTSGDVYVFAIKNWGGGVYTVVSKNTLQ